MFNDALNEKRAKSERLTLNLERAWSFELLPLNVLGFARTGNTNVKFFVSKGKTKVWFSVWEIWIFMKGFTGFFFSLFFSVYLIILSFKSQPLPQSPAP